MRIVVLCGPPCSGKTTLARTVADPQDVVIDFDDYARSLGSPVSWTHPEPFRTQAEEEVQFAIQQARLSTSGATAWLIRSSPFPTTRLDLALSLGATVYLLNPGKTECLRRALNRPMGTARAIERWYRQYRPWRGDRDPSELWPCAPAWTAAT